MRSVVCGVKFGSGRAQLVRGDGGADDSVEPALPFLVRHDVRTFTTRSRSIVGVQISLERRRASNSCSRTSFPKISNDPESPTLVKIRR